MSKSATSYIRSTLTAARTLAGREIRFTDTGITLVDALGDEHPLASLAARPSTADMIETLKGRMRDESWHSGLPEEINLTGHGVWTVAEKDGAVTLKSKRPRAPCLEAIAAFDADSLARLRSLYGTEGVNIVMAVEGEARARDLALALASEMTLSGHPAALTVPMESGRYETRDETREDQEGPPIFASPSGPAWSVRLMAFDERLSDADKPGAASSAIICVDRHAAWRYGEASPEKLKSRDTPTVIVGVSMEKSSPVGKIVLSDTAAALAAKAGTAPEGPWTRFNERRARLAAKVRPPKTWHPSTEAVAEAFLERKAPRGLVSGQSLFFHGPVAFSIYYANPVAAIVDTSGGPVIFVGRSAAVGGTKAGTISMAQGDVQRAAAKAGVPVYHVGRLTDFLTLDGKQLDNIALGFEHRKDEAEFSRTCKVDKADLVKYLEDRKKHAEAELVQANRQTAPTYTKAHAWRGLQLVAELRDALAEKLKLKLPPLGDSAEYESKYKETNQATAVWLKERAERKQAAAKAKQNVIEGDDDVPVAAAGYRR